MRYDHHAIRIEGHRLTFPTKLKLPPICLKTGIAGSVEYQEQEFEYLPGTAPGGAEPKKRRATVQIPVNAARAFKERRRLSVLAIAAMLSNLLRFKGSILVMIIGVLGAICELVFRFYCYWTKNLAIDPIDCMKIEGEGDEERITLRIATAPAQAMTNYLEACRAKELRDLKAAERTRAALSKRRHSRETKKCA